MLIGNKSNSGIVINTDLVTDFLKGKREENHKKTFTIIFGFAAMSTDEELHAVWGFEKEKERDAVWNSLMDAMSVQVIG